MDLWNLVTLLLLGVVVLAAMWTVNAVRQIRRHRTRANKRFLAAYRAGYRAARFHDRQTAVGVSSPPDTRLALDEE